MAIDPSMLGAPGAPIVADPAAMAPPIPALPDGLPLPAMQQAGMPLPPGVAPMAGMPLPPPTDPLAGLPLPGMAPQPKPPLLFVPDWLVDEIADQNLQSDDDLVRRAAEVLGPPRDTRAYSLDEQVGMYLAVPEDLADEADRDEVVAQMRESGKSEDEIRDYVYPLRRILDLMAGIETDPAPAVRHMTHVHNTAMARLNNLPDPEPPDLSADDAADDTSDEH